ncbi:MAG: DUF4249 domain-containing protein [Bacteroidales bacterium]|jgi:hypothetical protein|nr:DUF4249 domain-containing protein [Bacteroidales bacterium]
MARSTHIIPIFVMLLIAACTERMNIKTDGIPPRLVIYGYITSDTLRHSIRITRSASYSDTNPPEGVSHAAVTISTDNDTILLTESDTVPGLYLTSANTHGQMGKTYTLDVRLDFNNDGTTEHYQSSAYLTEINHIDSIRVQPSGILRNMLEILLYAQDLPEENFYSVFTSVNDSLINSTINDFFVMDDVFFNGAYMNGVPCGFLLQEKDGLQTLKKGDVITLNINAIPKEYALFIGHVQSEIRGSNPIFGGPPANVETNIRCIDRPNTVVSGFFTAFPSRYAKTIIDFDITVGKKSRD